MHTIQSVPLLLKGKECDTLLRFTEHERHGNIPTLDVGMHCSIYNICTGHMGRKRNLSSLRTRLHYTPAKMAALIIECTDGNGEEWKINPMHMHGTFWILARCRNQATQFLVYVGLGQKPVIVQKLLRATYSYLSHKCSLLHWKCMESYSGIITDPWEEK